MFGAGADLHLIFEPLKADDRAACHFAFQPGGVAAGDKLSWLKLSYKHRRF